LPRNLEPGYIFEITCGGLPTQKKDNSTQYQPISSKRAYFEKRILSIGKNTTNDSENPLPKHPSDHLKGLFTEKKSSGGGTPGCRRRAIVYQLSHQDACKVRAGALIFAPAKIPKPPPDA
jgi:hypothetical protein